MPVCRTYVVNMWESLLILLEVAKRICVLERGLEQLPFLKYSWIGIHLLKIIFNFVTACEPHSVLMVPCKTKSLGPINLWQPSGTPLWFSVHGKLLCLAIFTFFCGFLMFSLRLLL